MGPAVGGGATDIEEDRMRSVVLWIGWSEALSISYHTTSRHLEIESLGVGWCGWGWGGLRQM